MTGICFIWFLYLLSHFYLSFHRWSKANPERNNFSAGIHASLPQATHPEGIFYLSLCLIAPHTAALRKYGDRSSVIL